MKIITKTKDLQKLIMNERFFAHTPLYTTVICAYCKTENKTYELGTCEKCGASLTKGLAFVGRMNGQAYYIDLEKMQEGVMLAQT